MQETETQVLNRPNASRRTHTLKPDPRVSLPSLSPWHGAANLARPSKLSGDPRNRKEALAADSEGWTISMDKEIKNHSDCGSWVWMRRNDVPAGRHLIKLVWVFKKKRDGKLKSRLCVQGCAQTAGVDYHQTFSAALRSTSLRLLASLAARRGIGWLPKCHSRQLR